MPTDIETSRAFVKERTEKTRAAQATLTTDSAWTWPGKTLAQWDADISAMDAPVPGSLAKTTKALEVDMLAARGDSRRAIEDEADGLLAAWEEWESQIPGQFIPATGKSLLDFRIYIEGNNAVPPATVIASVLTVKKNYKAAQTKWRRSEGALNALYSRCEDECVAWYEEATAVWAAGTAEGDIIRGQVPTDYNPPTPPPPAPPAP